MKFKVGDWVIVAHKGIFAYVDPALKEVNLYKKIGKILGSFNMGYYIEFKEFINGHEGGYSLQSRGKFGYCWWMNEEFVQLYIDYLKLKKFVEYGV